jgi:hypothetical protein
MKDVDMSHVFPLEPFFRRHRSAAFWMLLGFFFVGQLI